MPYLILGVVLLGLLLLAARLVVSVDAAKLVPFMGWLAAGISIAGVGAWFISLMISDRFGQAMILATGSAFTVLRGRAMWRRYHGADKLSKVKTTLLHMRLDHETGAMSGEVRRGPYAGSRLEDLNQEELIALWRQCVAEDEPSARLLESYLDRLRPDWRQAGGDAGSASATPGEPMTRDDAYAILDLAPGASVEAIKDAHRRLMMKLHPDHGGSTFLAAQINRAKALLLGE